MKFYRYILTIVLIAFSGMLFSQSFKLNGCVKDANTSETVGFAIVGIPELNVYTTCNADGVFILNNTPCGEHELEIQCLGFQKTVLKVNVQDSKSVTVKIAPLSFQLSEVTVTAKEDQQNGTQSKINQQAMMHIQPTSIADVMQLLPGNTSTATNMSQVNSISLRQSGSDANTALGTAFIVDGIPESNNANLQYISGSSNDNKTSGRINTSSGVDLREIATDDIESVEVIRGIPSVAYGELTSGAVVIKRKEGLSKHKLRVKASLRQKLISYSKGFRISPNSGVFNFDVSFLDYVSDPSSNLENYKRLNSSLRYAKSTTMFGLPLKVNASGNYTFTLDQEKEDPELNYGQPDYYKSTYNKASLNSVSKLTTNSKAFKQIQFKLRGSMVHTVLERERLVSPNGPTPAPQGFAVGIHDSEYLPSQYLAYSMVDGMPVNAFTQLQSSGNWGFIPFPNQIKFGAEYNIEKNLGRGEVYDVSRPIFPGSFSSRPRDFSEIPALQRLSFYAEQRVTIPIKDHRLKVQAGLRTASLLNLSELYAMSGKPYFDPRSNIVWKLPKFKLFDEEFNLSLHVGAGWHTKLPVMSQLFPNTTYRDIIQLNYYSQDESLRRLNLISYQINPINYDLQAARNRKFETGVQLESNGYDISLTVFDELLESGFSGQTQYIPVSYIDYNEGSVPSSSLQAPPSLDDFDYQMKKYLLSYGRVVNGRTVHKQGVEYTVRLPRIDIIKTRITINGAYFNTRYDNSTPVTVRPSQIINGEPYPYVGVYESSKSSDRYQQFNTNFRFDTHIPKLNMIASTSIQAVWFKQRTNIETEPLPTNYIDLDGEVHPFTAADANDDLLSYLVLKFPDSYLETDFTPISVALNFKLTKEIKDYLRMAFYVNKLLDYNPSYINKYNRTVYRTVSPTFGMEISVKF